MVKISGFIKNAVQRLTNVDKKANEEGNKDIVKNKDPTKECLLGLKLSDLERVATIGVGGFGRVELVQPKDNPSKSYALKQMKKKHIVKTGQQEHVMNERKVLLECDSKFVVKLHKTFKDADNVYMLMESCLGADLWTRMSKVGVCDESTTKFYAGCMVEALAYLHDLGIIFRDLKPENLLLDQSGYLKLVDFGFSKKIGTERTFTFCGTPDYMAPEIIMGIGHDFRVDLWSLGTVLYDMLTGISPFYSTDKIATYTYILKGIGIVFFPDTMSASVISLIRNLCKDEPDERIGGGKMGIRAIAKHKWFHGFDWKSLRKGSMEPPYIPTIQSTTDTSNFDSFPDREESKCESDTNKSGDDESSHWADDF